MPHLEFSKEITALLVTDPYNEFISAGGEIWDRIKKVDRQSADRVQAFLPSPLLEDIRLAEKIQNLVAPWSPFDMFQQIK